jgi:hypothetical protein
MTRTTKLLAALFAGAAFIAPALAAQSPSAPRMSDVMSPSEMRETGLASLTPAQRAALDAWLARYTTIVEHAASYGAQAGGTAAASAPDNNGGVSYSGPPNAEYGSRITEVRDGGGYVKLADNTVWEVLLAKRPEADTWKVGDYVLVSARAVVLGGDYYFELINGRSGHGVEVKFKGKE